MVADNLAERFGQPLWRFANSGTEATMDAVHLMRAATGRDRILKVEGCYHGHHDSVQVSVLPEADDDIGPADRPRSASPTTPGSPTAIIGPGDRRAVQRPRRGRAGADRAPGRGRRDDPRADHDERRHHPPRRRLPRRAARTCCTAHGALLTFDEVKTGLTVGPGGVTRLLGVTPDLVCLAKAIGGGVSTAAIGGSDEVMALIARRRYEQVGTFNGNPLAMAAARAMLTEVLDAGGVRPPRPAPRPDARRPRRTSSTGTALPWRVVTAGAKGCVSFLPDPIRNFRDFLDARRPLRPRPLARPAQPRRLPAARGARSSSG